MVFDDDLEDDLDGDDMVCPDCGWFCPDGYCEECQNDPINDISEY